VSAAGWQRLDDVAATLGQPLRARFGGETILVFRTAAGLRGVAERCPHADYSLVHADILEAGALLRCNFHNFIFRLADGAGANCLDYRLAVFDVKDEAGALYARRAGT
jgi:nitrite reductase/ring-hydroxylating ferredoxin subunit